MPVLGRSERDIYDKIKFLKRDLKKKKRRQKGNESQGGNVNLRYQAGTQNSDGGALLLTNMVPPFVAAEN